MVKAGGIIALVAGVFGILAAVATLIIGGIGDAVDADRAETAIALGWGGMLTSFIVIVLGAALITTARRWLAVTILAVSAVGVVVGGTFVAVFMGLSALGGVLGWIGAGRHHAS